MIFLITSKHLDDAADESELFRSWAQPGKVSVLNTGTPMVATLAMVVNMVTRVSTAPARIMSQVLRPPAACTMAFGAVETGRRKARLDTRVAGSMRYSGLMPSTEDNWRRTGRSIEAVATLEATWVKMEMRTQIRILRTVGSRKERRASCAPTQ